MEYRMRIMQEMSLMEKLNILSDAAKYDVRAVGAIAGVMEKGSATR